MRQNGAALTAHAIHDNKPDRSVTLAGIEKAIHDSPFPIHPRGRPGRPTISKYAGDLIRAIDLAGSRHRPPGDWRKTGSITTIQAKAFPGRLVHSGLRSTASSCRGAMTCMTSTTGGLNLTLAAEGMKPRSPGKGSAQEGALSVEPPGRNFWPCSTSPSLMAGAVKCWS
jgi:hypothetical protein